MFTFISLFHDMDIKMLYNKKNCIIQDLISNTDFPLNRLNMERLERCSPLLLQWFLSSVFIETDINVQQGALFCDSLSEKGLHIWAQVCSVRLVYISSACSILVELSFVFV